MTNDYLTQKPPMRALTVFVLPIIIGNLFQQFYTMVDSAIVGRFVSQEALAAIGACYALTNVFIWVAVGGGIGASVVVSRYFGAKDYGRMKRAACTALFSFLAVSIVLGIIGLAFGRPLMQVLRTPEDVMGPAMTYLNIYFLGLPFLFMYNALSSMFNALGKSRIPLFFLIFSSVFNCLLDLLLVLRFDMGVAGVAWATLIAQGLSALLSGLVFMRVIKSLDPGRSGLFSVSEMTAMVRIALPSIMQQSTVSIGLLLVQSVVNSFGSEVLAGFSACMRLEAIAVVPMSGISTAVSAYTAQNIGAGKLTRVPEGYKAANLMVVFFGLLLFLVMEGFCDGLIRIFLGDEGTQLALATGHAYLRYMGIFFCLIGFKMASDGVLRGAGDMKMFTVANLANLTLRVVLAMLMAPRFGVAWVWIPVPMGWFLNWLISYGEYRTGKWRRIYTANGK